MEQAQRDNSVGYPKSSHICYNAHCIVLINNGISIKSRSITPCYPMYPGIHLTEYSLTVHQTPWNLLYEQKCFIGKVKGYQSHCKTINFSTTNEIYYYAMNIS